MKVVEHLVRAKRPLISYEIIPPLRGGNLKSLLELIENLARYAPPFIDITSHAAQVIYEETQQGIRKKVKRKRPGTLGVCALIQNQYHIDAVPHLLCNGFTREETEDVLVEMKYLGIDNVLAVRGDELGYEKPVQDGRSVNRYAIDLVKQIRAMNLGRYLEEDLLDAEPSDFCIGVGGYPEKHVEAPNLETDLVRAKQKIEAGGEYIVTQMFFDNRHYHEYVAGCRRVGIEVPIIPGLKILTTQRHLTSLPRNFYVELPHELSEEVMAAESKKHVREIGVEWAAKQAEDLLNRGAPAVHFYVMQSSDAINMLMDRLKL